MSEHECHPGKTAAECVGERRLADPMHDPRAVTGSFEELVYAFDPLSSERDDDPYREMREALERGETIPVYDSSGRKVGHAVAGAVQGDVSVSFSVGDD
jgi:hypothetical protein